MTFPRHGGLQPGWLNDKTGGGPWLVGLDVSIAEREDVADGPRPHQFAEPGRVIVLYDHYKFDVGIN